MKTFQINSLKRACTFLAAGLTALYLTGCLGESSSSELEDEYLHVISTPSHGNVLADQDGKVLYFFTRDVSGESMCEGDCVSNWPVFYTDQFIPGNGLDGNDLDTITRTDGSTQLTHNGWPLYYFAGDETPGEVNGDGANNVWYVAKANYSLMIATGQLIGNDGMNYTNEYEEGDGLTTFFTDAEGRTLYRFIHDEANTNNFTDEDFGNNDVWPVFHAETDELPSGMDESDFGEITVHGEQQQLTYKGWPLYYFGQDQERGDTRGVSVPAPGVWPVINANTPEAP